LVESIGRFRRRAADQFEGMQRLCVALVGESRLFCLSAKRINVLVRSPLGLNLCNRVPLELGSQFLNVGLYSPNGTLAASASVNAPAIPPMASMNRDDPPVAKTSELLNACVAAVAESVPPGRLSIADTNV
jgi:hypothetical protein